MRLTPLEPWIASKIGRPGGRLSRSDVDAYTLARLNETLELARARSAFYRQRLAGAGRITDLQDVAALPFTTPEDLRENPLRFLCVSQDEILRVVTLDSSGTTGNPKRIYFTRADQELTIDFFAAGMSTFTGEGDRVLILLPCERAGSVGDLLAIALRRLGAHPIKHGPVRDVAAALAVLAGEKADCVVGVPTQVLALARSGSAARLKSALLTTDHVPAAIVAAVEAAWGCTVYNHYGMTEMGLGGGVECAARRGYHLREADMFFEIVDPRTGEPLPDGEQGEVVFTTLTRRGMPLIRYRTGDISRFVPGPCPCGTSLKTMGRIVHRADGRFFVGDGELTLATLDEALFAVGGVLYFSATLIRGPSDTLQVQVIAQEHLGAQVAHDAALALAAIPDLEDARSRGQLDVQLTVLATGYQMTGATKRVIMDRRATRSGG